MDICPELFNGLEDLLVREFRTCQALHKLTRQERDAIAKQDARLLLALVIEKEALLDELERLEEARRSALQEAHCSLGLTVESLSLSQVCSALGQDSGSRVNHLRSGIQALIEQVRDLTRANQALAGWTLDGGGQVHPTGETRPLRKARQSQAPALPGQEAPETWAESVYQAALAAFHRTLATITMYDLTG